MKQIAAAFVKAKRAFSPALKTSTNPAFKKKYADLGACLDAVNDALLDSGIAVVQETSEDPDGVTVETVFIHESGETMRFGKLHVPAARQDPQGYGSALTYARRYSLMAACGIAPEDDDGNAASRQPAKAAQKPFDLDAACKWIKLAVDIGEAKRRASKASELAQTDEQKNAILVAYREFKEAATAAA